VSDIFREVEEDVRRERLEKLWKALWHYAIAALVLLFAGHRPAGSSGNVMIAGTPEISELLPRRPAHYQSPTAASTFADWAAMRPRAMARCGALSQAGAMFAIGTARRRIETSTSRSPRT